MTDSEILLAIEQIKCLKARYWYCVDTKHWAGMADVYAPDFEFDHRNAFEAVDPVTGESRVYGRPELLVTIDTSGWKAKGHKELAEMPGRLEAEVTVHQGYNPQITIHSATEASGIWPMQDRLRFGPDSPITEIHGFGHYHETYRKIDGQWLIQTNRLTRLRIDVL
jgi:hypothetical protein